MNLPDKFKFKNDDEEYSAEIIGSNVEVSWTEPDDYPGAVVYDLEIVQGLIEQGSWKIVGIPNGVDAKGNPSFFSKEDLKVGMRAYAGGGWYIVCHSKNYGVVLVDNHGRWNRAYLQSDVTSGREMTGITEVHDFPACDHKGLDHLEKGDLIWKYVSPKSTEQILLEEEIKRGEKFVVNTQTQVAALKQKLASLQK